MKLNQIKKALAANPDRVVRFILPTGSKIPPHAHVTEVARIEKKFIDCGGTQRVETTCRLQIWFQDDTEHRLRAGRLLAILEKSTSILQADDLDVDAEYEAPFLAQFPIEGIEAEGDELPVRLGVKHTACLAEDKCLPPKLQRIPILSRLPVISESKCCQ